MTFLRNKTLYCQPCNKRIHPELVTGKEIYPHREDLYSKYFWQCTYCESYVGCHPDTEKPLGCIVGSEVKQARVYIHDLLDPIWQSGMITRNQLYKQLSNELGYRYHTAGIRNMKEVAKVIALLQRYEIRIKPIEGDFE